PISLGSHCRRESTADSCEPTFRSLPLPASSHEWAKSKGNQGQFERLPNAAPDCSCLSSRHAGAVCSTLSEINVSKTRSGEGEWVGEGLRPLRRARWFRRTGTHGIQAAGCEPRLSHLGFCFRDA